jgi:hypothetical protein
MVFKELIDEFVYVVDEPVNTIFLELPDLSYHVDKEELFAPGRPVFNGSFPSNQHCRPEIDEGDTNEADELDPIAFVAIIYILYDVFPVSPVNTAYLLLSPWLSKGIVGDPFRLYV